MPKSRELTVAERGTIVGMKLKGATYAEIAGTVNCSTSTVQKVLKKSKDIGTLESMPRSGRPPIFQDRDLRELKRVAISNRRAPLADITNNLSVQASVRTVRKELRKMGFDNRVAAKKPFLNRRHRAARLAFARAHRHWTVQDWERVIWTDESSFELGKQTRQVRVWRRVHEKFESECLAATHKSGRTSLMVWGAFTSKSKSKLILMKPGRRSAADFIEDVYDAELEDYYFSITPDTPVLMEDGAPIHRARVSANWRELRGMVRLQWPAQSPDLNPIENLWHMCKVSVQRKVLQHNKDELWEDVLATWNELSQEKLRQLVETMPERIKAVIKAKGGSTRW